MILITNWSRELGSEFSLMIPQDRLKILSIQKRIKVNKSEVLQIVPFLKIFFVTTIKHKIINQDMRNKGKQPVPSEESETTENEFSEVDALPDIPVKVKYIPFETFGNSSLTGKRGQRRQKSKDQTNH